jgi:8-oxo-dGTP pyrophosphatase MutT (NUDIX family)
MKQTKRHLISLIKEALKEVQYTSKGHWGKKGAGVLLTTGERIFLLLRSQHVTEPHTWGIPGGAIDGRESALSSAIRELEEECGLSLDKYDVIDSENRAGTCLNFAIIENNEEQKVITSLVRCNNNVDSTQYEVLNDLYEKVNLNAEYFNKTIDFTMAF